MITDGPMIVHLLAGRPGGGKNDPAAAAALGVCGKERPLVACVGAANGDNPMFFAWMRSVLLAAGAGEVVPVKLASKRSDAGRARDALERADVVFMSGGDVEAGMGVLAARELVDWLRGLHAAGKPFFGISAGSIMLCRDWVRWRDPDDEASAETFPCLGLAPVWCDTHAEKEGFEELRALLGLLPEGAAGYGIPSGAAIAVTASGKVSALGKAVWMFGKRKGAVTRLADVPVGPGFGK
jgi:cyanophycinase-like exopeptidase